MPYKVRASCGHIVVRKMRPAAARVPYSEDAVLDAPHGRACDACEAKKDFGAHAPKPKAIGAFKAPELRDTAEIAKRIRAEIHEAVKKKDAFHVEKGAREISYDKAHGKSRYTPEVDRVLAKVNAIVDAYHWDRSDVTAGYHHERFHRSVRVDEGSEWTQLNARRATLVHEGAKP
jgi:hypothetical protein